MSLEEDISCTYSLVEALEAQGGFYPLETRKRLEPGEGLTKIWMCPSSELATALFSTKPETLSSKNLGRESLNLIDKLNNDRKKTLGSESGSSSSSTFEWTHDESEDQSDVSIYKPEGSALESSISSQVSLKDEKIDNLKRSLKQIYNEKLETGANMLMKYSLELLDQKMYSLVKEIRQHEENIIKKELKPVLDFIERYKVEVNRENDYLLKRKYRNARREGITRLIDAAEESFTHRCLQMEKQLKEKYNYRVEKMKNNYYTNYRERIRVDLKKWIDKFKGERNTMMKDYDNAVASIKEEYNKLYAEQKATEERKVQEEIDKIKQLMAEFESAEKPEPKEPYEKCSEDSGWLCILHQLLTDMQLFMRTNISSECDVRQLISKIKQQKAAYNKRKSKLMSGVFVPSTEIQSDKEPSVLTIPCIKDRDEEVHQALIQEAGLMLEKILSDISRGIITKEDFDLIWKHIFLSKDTNASFRVLLKHFQSDEDFSRSRLSFINSTTESSENDIFHQLGFLL